ncbi:hypothetical protein GOP47_0008923 [Adiantum capillus-veneris]|uniref:Uncharacterized protein n=1 Tax=Adiantum capillus-veneris TaxID=13818 RepID=A0A9D4UZG8_ADICA|nr:hypothetical protein GOP47_0008923 [Adiantum capillus-veneris]
MNCCLCHKTSSSLSLIPARKYLVMLQLFSEPCFCIEPFIASSSMSLIFNATIAPHVLITPTQRAYQLSQEPYRLCYLLRPCTINRCWFFLQQDCLHFLSWVDVTQDSKTQGEDNIVQGVTPKYTSLNCFHRKLGHIPCARNEL